VILPAFPGALALATPILAIAIGDASSAWESAGRPTDGVYEKSGWVLSCFSQQAELGSDSFAEVDLAGCKQEATIAMVEHCAGKAKLPASVPAPVRPMVESALSGWFAYRVQASGVTWVHCARSKGVDLVVMALPAQACKDIPRGIDWLPSTPDIAAWTKGWVIAGALVEACDGNARERVAAIMGERMIGSLDAPAEVWPVGFTKLPEGLPTDAESKLSLQDLAVIAGKRPGDVALWSRVADRCESMQMREAAQAARGLPERAKWPQPAPSPSGHSWSGVQTGDLPGCLVAVIRTGGGIACRASTPGDVSREAQQAFFAKTPDLLTAEVKAREAAAMPDPDALNLLAAIRLADSRASDDTLRQALAFAWQARAVRPSHPYAAINALRAMQRLSMPDEARALLQTLPTATPDTWARRETDKVSAWLATKDGGRGAAPR
jgi:hypothetical protein